MPIEFYCKTCQKRLRCPDNAAGSKARCPQCNEINNVPLFSDPPPIAPPSSSYSSQEPSYPAPPQPLSPAMPPAPTPPPAPPLSHGASDYAPKTTPTAFSPPAWTPPPSGGATGHEFQDAPQKAPPNPYSSPVSGAGMAPPQPVDQSATASSLGVISIVVGSVSLIFGFCCCPIGAIGALSGLGMGIWGWRIAAIQLNQTKYAPYLRHLEPAARTALVLCIIGTIVSGLATLLVGGGLVFMIISSVIEANR